MIIQEDFMKHPNGNFLVRDSRKKTDKSLIKKKVTLIACPWSFYDVVEFRSQQLGLGYVGAYAQKFGHEIIAFIDPMINGGDKIKVPVQTKYQTTNRFGFSDEWIISKIPKETDIIGINAPFTDSRILLYPLTKKIKASFPNTILVIGGILATTLPRQVMEESGVDIVVKGEGEIAFSRILNDEPLGNIPGLLFYRDGKIIENPLRSEQLLSINDIPPPGYDFRPMEEYVRWSPRGNKADRTLSIISSRGCPMACHFCSIPEKGQRWRPFSPERTIQEIDAAIKKWGVNHIEFEDDNFTLKEGRAIEILLHLKKLRHEGYPVFCSFPNGIMIDRITKELAILMKDAGAEIIYLPVESGDTRILVGMNKPLAEDHLKKTLEVAKWCVEAGLFVSCFFIVGYPGGKVMWKRYNRPEYEKYITVEDDNIFMRGEDKESFEETLHFCKKLVSLGVNGITPLIATPYPGTEMYSYCEKNNFLAFPDEKDVLTTVSYAAMRPDFVQIETPWCSRKEAFERWEEMQKMFPVFHNIRKEKE